MRMAGVLLFTCRCGARAGRAEGFVVSPPAASLAEGGMSTSGAHPQGMGSGGGEEGNLLPQNVSLW